MTNDFSRRSLFQAAGGLTLLSLAPETVAAEPAPEGFGPLPVFTALPYLQPGPDGGRLKEGRESLVVAWQTNGVPATFELTYGDKGTERRAEVSQAFRTKDAERPGNARQNYWTRLEGLRLGTRYRYRVAMDGKPFAEGWFTTRKPRGRKTRFVAFGDNSMGDVSDRANAYQAYMAKPDFVMNTGDNVYASGRDDEYSRYFFPVYNATEAGSRIGAPLLRSVPFYSVLANHDMAGGVGPLPGVDFDRAPDGFAILTNLHLPLNGPVPTHPTPLAGRADRLAAFHDVAGERYPRMANYAFDYGDAHFVCLDSNRYVDPTDPVLQAWVEKELRETDAAWKFVVYHHPAFNVGNEHYDEQHMRALSPLFERCGVDVVLSGHEHNYQRTRPLRFAPRDLAGAKAVGGGPRLVPGTFAVDRTFDGRTATRPDGIVYITTGAGGNDLYDPQMNENPASWLHKEDMDADYVAKMVSDRHSLTVFDMDARKLEMRQVDEWGREIDRVTMTK